ncbi:unnamed protein product [Amoebophrya sp. A25]|nr:unnamed protein product [Amoebophrya sp. A25]|eukprot:GSA25T00010877001.1
MSDAAGKDLNTTCKRADVRKAEPENCTSSSGGRSSESSEDATLTSTKAEDCSDLQARLAPDAEMLLALASELKSTRTRGDATSAAEGGTAPEPRSHLAEVLNTSHCESGFSGGAGATATTQDSANTSAHKDHNAHTEDTRLTTVERRFDEGRELPFSRLLSDFAAFARTSRRYKLQDVERWKRIAKICLDDKTKAGSMTVQEQFIFVSAPIDESDLEVLAALRGFVEEYTQTGAIAFPQKYDYSSSGLRKASSGESANDFQGLAGEDCTSSTSRSVTAHEDASRTAATTKGDPTTILGPTTTLEAAAFVPDEGEFSLDEEPALPSITTVPELRHVESIYKVCDLYLWLVHQLPRASEQGERSSTSAMNGASTSSSSSSTSSTNTGTRTGGIKIKSVRRTMQRTAAAISTALTTRLSLAEATPDHSAEGEDKISDEKET